MIPKQEKYAMSAVFTTLILLLICCCNTGNKNQESTVNKNPSEGIQLFNGDNLDGWEVTSFGTEGPVQVTDNSIVLGMGDGLTGITWTGSFPTTNYLLTLEARKISGNDFFCGITFPYHDTFCSLIVGGWGGPVVGLSTINGLDASENETKVLMQFDTDRWYEIQLKVTNEKIEAWIDSVNAVNFTTSGKQLYIRPEVELSKPFGIASWNTTAAIRNITLKPFEQSP